MNLPRYPVTPYVGVWIETPAWTGLVLLKPSLLMWECGLKPPVVRDFLLLHGVTPYVGVWIETGQDIQPYVCTVSLLMWECGLKQR